MIKKNKAILTEEKVLDTIKQIRQLEIKKGFSPLQVYLHGDCGNLFFALKEKFPNAEPYVHEKHIVTLIEGTFYDIRGKYTKPIHNIEKASFAKVKAFTNNYNHNMSRKCTSIEQKLKYALRPPCPEMIPFKTRLRILRDDFKKGIHLKDLPMYFSRDRF